jgi:probable O-glycosylation ligase (exosortase A-associated)
MVDNNGYAFALCVALPLLVGIALAEQKRWMRVTAAVLAVFTVVSVIFTFSRGGLVMLGVVGLLLLLRSRRPVVAGLVVAAAAGLDLRLTSEEFKDEYRARAESISAYEEDGSAMGRIEAWQTALAVAREYPVLGVGPANFMTAYRRFGDPGAVRVTHNVYLQWLTDSGVPAIALFVAMLAVTVVRMLVLARTTPHSWAAIYARMIGISVVGFAAGAMFLDKAYYDLLYHLIALSVCLELASESVGTEAAAAAPVAEPPWWTRPVERPV